MRMHTMPTAPRPSKPARPRLDPPRTSTRGARAVAAPCAASSTPLPIGAAVVVSGLKQRADLNGMEAVVLDFDRGKHLVRMAKSGAKLRLKPPYLCAIDPQSRRGGRAKTVPAPPDIGGSRSSDDGDSDVNSDDEPPRRLNNWAEPFVQV